MNELKFMFITIIIIIITILYIFIPIVTIYNILEKKFNTDPIYLWIIAAFWIVINCIVGLLIIS